MGKAKHNIPMVVIDTRTSQQTVIESEQQNRMELVRQEPQLMPELEELLQRFLVNIYQQMLQLYEQAFDFFNELLRGRKVPWFKIGLIALVAFVLLKKDMQFNIALKAPMPIFKGEEQEDRNGLAQAMSLTGADRSNPYAPASAKMLKDKKTVSYIKNHAPIAIKEMHSFGIPASIKMAQALVESRSGSSMLAQKNNNHFGMKCFSRKCNKGHCTNAYDDHHKDFFRKFASAKDSWEAHSRLISQGRYAHLTQLGRQNYKAWAYGLKKAGYATDKRYAEKLINTIEKYQLYELDKH